MLSLIIHPLEDTASVVVRRMLSKQFRLESAVLLYGQRMQVLFSYHIFEALLVEASELILLLFIMLIAYRRGLYVLLSSGRSRNYLRQFVYLRLEVELVVA